jgi:transcriptional regulator with XRE-family HTH domain
MKSKNILQSLEGVSQRGGDLQRQGIALGQRLKLLAQAAGYTAERLAERIGCSTSAVWAWWRGRNEPSIEMLKAYAAAVGVSVDTLIDTGDPEATRAAVLMIEWQRRVKGGEDAVLALAAVTDQDPALEPQERARLSRLTGELSKWFRSQGGDDWARLDPEERHCVLELIRLLARRSVPSDQAVGSKDRR